MAQLDRNKSINGAIGNVVFKTIGGKQILQSKPDSIRHTERTKAAASEFRQCSKWGTRLRKSLVSFLAKEEGGYMHSRLNGQLYAAIQQNNSLPKGERNPLNSDMASLAGFEFNTYSPFAEHFLPEIEVTLNNQRQVEITVPEFQPATAIKFAKGTKQAELLLYVLATDFESGSGFRDAYTVVPVPNNYQAVPETNWTSPPMEEGKLILVCAKLLLYNTNRFTEKHYINSKAFSPAGVLMVTS